MKTWALIANAGVLETIQSDNSPGSNWREVVGDMRPTPSAGEEVVETGWAINETTAQRTFAVVQKTSGQPVLVAPVVSEVSNWALEEELSERGLSDGLNTAINSLPAGASRNKARARWNKKPTIRRNDPLVAALAQVLALTSAQVDDIFAAASNRQ